MSESGPSSPRATEPKRITSAGLTALTSYFVTQSVNVIVASGA